MDVAEDVTDDEEEKTATPTSEPSKGDQNSSEQKTPLSLQNYYLVCDDYILRLMVMVMVSNLIYCTSCFHVFNRSRSVV